MLLGRRLAEKWQYFIPRPGLELVIGTGNGFKTGKTIKPEKNGAKKIPVLKLDRQPELKNFRFSGPVLKPEKTGS